VKNDTEQSAATTHIQRTEKIADDLARKAHGLDVNEGVSQFVLSYVNETLEGCET
jgi:hypothetical protein